MSVRGLNMYLNCLLCLLNQSIVCSRPVMSVMDVQCLLRVSVKVL